MREKEGKGRWESWRVKGKVGGKGVRKMNEETDITT